MSMAGVKVDFDPVGGFDLISFAQFDVRYVYCAEFAS
jgi:hypothetical protein